MKTGESISAAEYLQQIKRGKQGGRQVDQLGSSKPNKYRNKPVMYDGIRFASKKEGDRYAILKLLEKQGMISALVLQPKFKFEGLWLDRRECMYIADFQYMENGKLVVEDTKGFKTDVYKIKRGLMKRDLGIEIFET